MGNKLVAAYGQHRASQSTRAKRPSQSQSTRAKRPSQSRDSLRHVTSPTLHHGHSTHKRRSRSQSEGVTSDCSTALSLRNSMGSEKGLRLVSPRMPITEEDDHVESRSATWHAHEQALDQTRRIREAETILVEIAKEYAAKRAAGLVPTKPVPARTLLWEELEQRAQRARVRIGRRGTCVYGRDSDAGCCGCVHYQKASHLPYGREVCAGCHHGAPWHRLAGGTMSGSAPGGTRSRSSRRSSRASPLDVRLDYSFGSDYYDEYDPEYESDGESEDDEAIANEVARPYNLMQDPTPPLLSSQARSEGEAPALTSPCENFGLPPRLSSTSRQLAKLLSAIAKYRALGFAEDEIEQKIRQDFPPTDRLSYSGTNARRMRAISR